MKYKAYVIEKILSEIEFETDKNPFEYLREKIQTNEVSLNGEGGEFEFLIYDDERKELSENE